MGWSKHCACCQKTTKKNPSGGKQKLFCEYDSFGRVSKLTATKLSNTWCIRKFRSPRSDAALSRLAEQSAIQAGGQKECDNQVIRAIQFIV